MQHKFCRSIHVRQPALRSCLLGIRVSSRFFLPLKLHWFFCSVDCILSFFFVICQTLDSCSVTILFWQLNSKSPLELSLGAYGCFSPPLKLHNVASIISHLLHHRYYIVSFFFAFMFVICQTLGSCSATFFLKFNLKRIKVQ